MGSVTLKFYCIYKRFLDPGIILCMKTLSLRVIGLCISGNNGHCLLLLLLLLFIVVVVVVF